MLRKLLKWAYGDSLRYIAFMVLAYLIVAAFLVFIFYPLQTILAVVGVFVFIVLFTFVSEYK